LLPCPVTDGEDPEMGFFSNHSAKAQPAAHREVETEVRIWSKDYIRWLVYDPHLEQMVVHVPLRNGWDRLKVHD
jgi:hypothetical protein